MSGKARSNRSKKNVGLLQYRFSKNVTPEKLEGLKKKLDKFLVNEAIPEQDFIGQDKCGGIGSIGTSKAAININCECVGGT